MRDVTSLKPSPTILSLASQMVALYRQLYAVEYRGALLSAQERLELRQRDALPIWNRIQAWLDQDEVKRLLPKSDIGEAVGYLRNQWDALRHYLGDGQLPIDNNHSERVIRPLTIGRNYSEFPIMLSYRLESAISRSFSLRASCRTQHNSWEAESVN